MKMLKDKKNRKLRIISFVILFLAAIVFLAPYFWMLSNSFKSTKDFAGAYEYAAEAVYA